MNRLTFRSLIAALGLIVLLSLPSVASADGVTWTLDGVTFGDWTTSSGATIGTGGSASGSFVFDALALPFPLYSNISVSTTPWATLLAPTSYTSLTPLAVSNSLGLGLGGGGSDLTNISFLFLVFDTPLTNAGGTIGISLVPGDSMEVLCLDSGCDSFDTRSVTGGEVSGVAVVTPEPAAFLLLGIGLLALLIGSAIRQVVSA